MRKFKESIETINILNNLRKNKVGLQLIDIEEDAVGIIIRTENVASTIFIENNDEEASKNIRWQNLTFIEKKESSFISYTKSSKKLTLSELESIGEYNNKYPEKISQTDIEEDNPDELRVVFSLDCSKPRVSKIPAVFTIN